MKRTGRFTRHMALLFALLVLTAWLPAAALADGDEEPQPAGQSSAQDSAAAGGQGGVQQLSLIHI